MNWLHFRNSLVNQYHERAQTCARIDIAVEQVRAGLDALAQMGHPFHLSAGPSPVIETFPRQVFHLEKAPLGFLVLCEEDLLLLGEGWFDTLDQAKHADGMGEQFKRGGVFPQKGLPALMSDFVPSRLDAARQFEGEEE